MTTKPTAMTNAGVIVDPVATNMIDILSSD